MRKILGFSVLFLLVVVGVVLFILWKTGVLFNSSSAGGNSGSVHVKTFQGQTLLG